MDLVQKRGRALANRCFMCHENEETVDHLLIHCAKTGVCIVGDVLFFGRGIMGASFVG